MNITSNSINKVSLFSAPDIECDGCANAIQNALGKMPGVTVVAVSVPDKTVAVTHELATAPDAAIIAALDRAGFPVAQA